MRAGSKQDDGRFCERAGPRVRHARRRRVALVPAALAAAMTLVLASCSSSSNGSSSGGSGSGKPSGQLVVFAATSLTDAFNKIGTQFEKANPGVTVKFNYNGSSSLATQINQGAPADIFASASPKNMTTVTDQQMTSTAPKDFASNSGEIMVEAGNPGHIKSLADLANSSVKVVTCAPDVPCGA